MEVSAIDKNFPVFTLACCIFEQEYYLEKVNPIVDRLKYFFFGHRGVILHSSDIRKRKNEYRILNNIDTNQRFMRKISELINDLEYDILASSVHKEKHLETYRNPKHPYDLTFEFIYEKLFFYMKNLPNGPHECIFVAESRNENQNAELRTVYSRLRKHGNFYFSASEFKEYVKGLRFHPKKYNETGNQIADLVAYPISRFTLDKANNYEPFEIVYSKIYKGNDNNKLNYGLKIFP